MSAELVTPEIARIAPYEPGKPLEELERELGAAWPREGAIKLASNENPLGPSPRAIEAAGRALAATQLYPDGGSHHLRDRLARHLGVELAQVVAGSGSNELIDLIVQAFCGPGEEVLAPACSFVSYRLAAEKNRRAYRESPNGPGFAYDLEALARSIRPETKVVFLANPNNPTGVYATRAELERFLSLLPERVILVLDEAYFEYVTRPDYPDGLSYLRQRERLISLRTFSKIYGLAGFRVGYAVGRPEIVGWLHRVRLPFNLTSVSQAAARAALDDVEHVDRARRHNSEELPRISEGLGRIGLEVTPSQGNFVLAGPFPRDGREIYQALLGRGVIVRPMGLYGLPRHLRISIGTRAENDRLLTTLTEVV